VLGELTPTKRWRAQIHRRDFDAATLTL